MGEVLEYLVDGTSGIAPGGVDGKALVAGVCSKGTVGKGYLVGKHSDLQALLGTGPLVDRLRDMLTTGGQNPVLVAVPVEGRQGGYITTPTVSGSTVTATVSGLPSRNADVAVRVALAGALGTAKVEISTDGGKSYGEAQISAAQIVIGSGQTATGATLCFAEDALLENGAVYRFVVRCAVGAVSRVGESSSPLPEVKAQDGGVLDGAELVVQIVKSGDRNEGTYQLSTDGGDNFLAVRTIPLEGAVALADLGISLTFPAGKYLAGTSYHCRLLPPTPSIVDVMTALESPLSLYDVEFVHIAAASDAVDWAAAQAKAEELWNAHRPTYFKMESRLPYDNEDLHDFTAYLLAEKQHFAGRFVTVCCQYGEIVDSTGASRLRAAAALHSGRVVSIPVQRAAGRVKDGAISQLTLPQGWEAVQSTLEAAGYITAKKYAGLAGAYWGDSRTLAEDTSDYRYEEVLRTTFKAVRKLRIAALKSLYDEAGDPLRSADASGLAYLQASLENALSTMTSSIPQELAAFVVEIPQGQDIVNNGVAVDVKLIGIPIIREIKLFAHYIYAGSGLDPRLADNAAA